MKTEFSISLHQICILFSCVKKFMFFMIDVTLEIEGTPQRFFAR
jgi:hypothetical protein